MTQVSLFHQKCIFPSKKCFYSGVSVPP
jgi:hypothetical protein